MVELPSFSDLIGCPFVYGGRGPSEYDCWGLVMQCYQRAHGRAIPDLKSPEDPAVQAALGATLMAQPYWTPVNTKPGSIVAIRVGDYITHAGFALTDHHMIHAWKATGGVTIVPMSFWQRRIEGFYRYAG